MELLQNESQPSARAGPRRARNWIALPPDAPRLTTRHYYEEETCAAADPRRHPALEIEMLEKAAAPPPAPNDASVAAGLRRVANFVRARTLEMPPPGSRPQPSFVSTTPNQFPAPAQPAGLGLAALDTHYSMAPYVLGPEQALVIRGRWPTCRCANVDLWSRHQQTYDYVNRQVTLNRKQTKLEPDGSFRIVIAHQNPGVPNWLDTEGRPFGMVFWDQDRPPRHLGMSLDAGRQVDCNPDAGISGAVLCTGVIRAITEPLAMPTPMRIGSFPAAARA